VCFRAPLGHGNGPRLHLRNQRIRLASRRARDGYYYWFNNGHASHFVPFSACTRAMNTVPAGRRESGRGHTGGPGPTDIYTTLHDTLHTTHFS
jgi:hypothetical protein